MVSPLTILKDVLNLKHSRMHVSGWEEREETIQRYGETYQQNRIYVCCDERIPTNRADYCPGCILPILYLGVLVFPG